MPACSGILSTERNLSDLSLLLADQNTMQSRNFLQSVSQEELCHMRMPGGTVSPISSSLDL